MDALGSALKEKTHTWNRTRKEGAKREIVLYKIKEIVANDKQQEDKERRRLKETLNKLRQEREEENEARALLQEMQQNLDEAHARASETERKMCRECGEYTHSWEQELGRPVLHHGQNVADDAKQ